MSRSKLQKNWRTSREGREWRAKVIRKGVRCYNCNCIKHRQAHHINPARYFPEQIFDVSNGICLCKRCHSILHNKFAGGTRKMCSQKHLDRMAYVFSAFSTYPTASEELT